jgi:hypothetical protein
MPSGDGRPVRGPHHRDIRCQTRTPAAPGARCQQLSTVLRSLLYDAETFQVSSLLVPAALLGLSSLIAGARFPQPRLRASIP